MSAKLPTEVWIKILGFFLHTDDDLPFLWVTCRHVTGVFRESTELLFRERYLPKLRITYQLGNRFDEDRGRYFDVSCDFQFERLSEDKGRAILSMSKDLDEDHRALCWKRIPNFMKQMSTQQIELPDQIVQIRRDLNDGPVPAQKFDTTTSELSCDWRELLTVFYGEEFLYHKILMQAVEDSKPTMDIWKEQVGRGEMDPHTPILKALEVFAESHTRARKQARRARIKRQFQEFDGTEWDFARDGDEIEEDKAIKALQKARQLASFETWSDNGSENDEDEEDEDDAMESEEDWATEEDNDE